MPPRTLFAIGVNLIFLAHVQSFVLLTANFEDVKKLAQKFVSDSIAEKIAELIGKASGSDVNLKASKENVSVKSKENQNRIEPDFRIDENKESELITKESISKENMKYKPKTIKSKLNKKRLQSKFLRSSEKTSKKAHPKDKKTSKLGKNKRLKLTSRSKLNNFNDISGDSGISNVSVDSTAGYVENGELGKNLTKEQEADSESDYVFRFNDNEDMKEGKSYTERSVTLTTRKEKFEFDQYDNTNYPKAVATSGSVTLPRLLDFRKSRYRDE